MFHFQIRSIHWYTCVRTSQELAPILGCSFLVHRPSEYGCCIILITCIELQKPSVKPLDLRPSRQPTFRCYRGSLPCATDQYAILTSAPNVQALTTIYLNRSTGSPFTLTRSSSPPFISNENYSLGAPSGLVIRSNMTELDTGDPSDGRFLRKTGPVQDQNSRCVYQKMNCGEFSGRLRAHRFATYAYWSERTRDQG